jgi:hypothetical protein
MAHARRIVLMRAALLAGCLLVAREARAQVRFSYIGAGSTPQGDMMRGEGIALAGAGEFVRNNAVAESIHVDTWVRLQQYLAVTEHERSMRFEAQLKRRRENINLSLAAIRKRLRENPTESDLMTGDALNAMLEDLTSPNISPSDLMRSRVPLSVSFVHQVPFHFPTMGGTVSMRVLTVKEGWPLSLRGDAFARERRIYLAAVDRVLEEISQGKLMPGTVDRLHAAITGLQDQVDATIPKAELNTYVQARDFVKVLSEPAKLLQNQAVERMLAQLERYPGTTIAELLEFMAQNNIQFSPASVQTERELYRQLYPLLRQQREVMAARGNNNLNNEPAIDPGKQ